MTSTMTDATDDGHRTSRRAWLRRDDGVSAILVCLLIVFLVIPVAAVSVDLSNAYANRRQMQNAADAASQAGAQYMNQVRLGLSTAAGLDKAVSDVAEANGSKLDSPYACHVATIDYSTTPPQPVEGPTCATWTGDATYTAVTVHTHHTVGTFFAGALGVGGSGGGVASTSAAASATASIQKIAGAESPFALCAYAYSNGAKGTEQPYDPTSGLLTQDGTALNLATPPIGNSYLIWGNGGGKSGLDRCGLGSSAWDGRICSASGSGDCSTPITLPGDIQVSTGAKVGPTVSMIAGYPGCDPTLLNGGAPFAPCGVTAPVCSGSNGSTGTNGVLHCVAWGAFVLSSTDGKSIYAQYEGAADIVNGTLCDPAAGSCTLSATDAYRIALVQ